MASQQSRSNPIYYVVYRETDNDQYIIYRPFLRGELEQWPSTLTQLNEAIQAACAPDLNGFNSSRLRLYQPGAMDYEGKLNPRRMVYDLDGLNETSYNIFHEDENKRPLIVIAPPSPAQQEVSNDDCCILLSPLIISISHQ